MKDWAEEDRPRKKLLLKGTDTLSNAELLAILINSGSTDQFPLDVARGLLNTVNNGMQKLASLSVKDMVKQKVKGLGEAKAIGYSRGSGIRHPEKRHK